MQERAGNDGSLADEFFVDAWELEHKVALAEAGLEHRDGVQQDSELQAKLLAYPGAIKLREQLQGMFLVSSKAC